MSARVELAESKSAIATAPAGEITVAPAAELAPAASGEPRWVGELWTQLAKRVGPFASTAVGFVLRPKAFVERWRGGESPAMNPFWFAASAAAVVTTLQTALLQALGAKEHAGLVETALKTLAPYAYFIEIGVAAHAVLYVLGSRRRLSSSVAMALYAGGTMATLGQLVVLAVLAAFQLATPADAPAAPPGAEITVIIALMLSFAGFYTSFSTAMGALHAVRPWRMLAANVAGFFVSSALCDFLPLPTLHVALRIWEHGHFVRPALYLASPFG
jgi:hypothetical protein